MTHIERILHHILHDPWASRVFLAFTVGMFLSCSAEFAAGQDTPTARAAAVGTFTVDGPAAGSMK